MHFNFVAIWTAVFNIEQTRLWEGFPLFLERTMHFNCYVPVWSTIVMYSKMNFFCLIVVSKNFTRKLIHEKLVFLKHNAFIDATPFKKKTSSFLVRSCFWHLVQVWHPFFRWQTYFEKKSETHALLYSAKINKCNKVFKSHSFFFLKQSLFHFKYVNKKKTSAKAVSVLNHDSRFHDMLTIHRKTWTYPAKILDV